MPRSSYRQSFESPGAGAGTLAAISIRLATYHMGGLPGTVLLTLTDGTGKVLRESRVDATGIKDNALERFSFNRPVVLHDGQRYAFLLSYEPGTGSPLRLTAWSFPVPEENAMLMVDGQSHAGIVEYQLHLGKPENDRHFTRVFEANGTAVLENIRSPRGPYFLPSLAATPDASSGAEVEVVDYAPDQFVLRYSGDAPGHVIVPMNAARDWFVTVEGQPGDFDLKDGVMPAVPVSGNATIEFSYRPRILRYLVPWLFATSGFLLALIVLERLASRRSSSRRYPEVV